MRPKLVLFDLDGTLVDSMGIYTEIASQLISEHYGLSKDEARKLYLKTSGLPFIKQLEIIFPEDEKNGRVAETFERLKGEVVKSLRIESEGVEVIKRLRDMGVLTAVSSNNLQEYVEEIVRSSGAKPDYVLGWDGKDFTKGEPHVEYLERKTGINRKNFLMVGDSLSDLKLAKSSGIEFVALLRHFKEEDFRAMDPSAKTIKALKDLLPLVKKFPDPSEYPNPVLPP